MTKRKTRTDIISELSGGDLRSIGKVNLVVKRVLDDTTLFRELVLGLSNDEPVIKMRCADALEKITAKVPELLEPFKKLLISEISKETQQEIRWHLAQMYPRMQLTASEQKRVVATLKIYLEDKSSIVRTFSMQALADIAAKNGTLKKEVTTIIGHLAQVGTPAMKARGRKLLERLRA